MTLVEFWKKKMLIDSTRETKYELCTITTDNTGTWIFIMKNQFSGSLYGFWQTILPFMAGLGACAFIIVIFAWAAYESNTVRNLQLTVDETLALIPKSGYEKHTAPETRFRWMKVANSNANTKLREIFQQPRIPRQRVTAAVILGYTGKKEDAEFLIAFLREQCARFEKRNPPEAVHPDDVILLEVLKSLGLMARRDIAPAKRFIISLAKGNDPLLLPIANPVDITIEYSLKSYSLMKPDDLKETARAALKRASATMQEGYAEYDWAEMIRWVEERESQPIWNSELEKLRRRISRK